jgi:predicted O-methyltransferase YrrM
VDSGKEPGAEPATATQDLPTREDALAAIEDTAGWLTDTQAGVLFDYARALEPPARIVEIGSHYGRSTVPLALGAVAGVEVLAIDPFLRPERALDDQRSGAEVADDDLERFEANLALAGVRDRVRHLRYLSREAATLEDRPVDLLFVDGDHSYSGARDDVVIWGSRLRPGGTLILHDAYSSLGVTLTQIVTIWPRGRFRYLFRERSLVAYRREDVSLAGRVIDAGRQLGGMAWFARNAVVKVALRTGAKPVARLLGHEGSDDPY